jgi:precorrin-3B C17-methyltransferase
MKACDILLRRISPETVCGAVRNIARDGEAMHVMPLARLREYKADMFTMVFVGNSQTRVIDGKMVTPRGYKHG